MSKLAEITTAMADLDEERAPKAVQEALKEGISGQDILKACQDGMSEVGARFQKKDYFISHLIVSGELFKQVGAILDPHLKQGDTEVVGKVVFGTVKGDIHDIGKNIVVNMLKSSGFEVIDVGVDASPAKFIEALKQSGASVVGLSGLLTLAFDSMRDTIAAVKAAGLRDQVKVMVGGGPVDANVCKSVGADGWGGDAPSAVKLAKQWHGVAV
jgi:5-methyltetrahydrofolate--homocysteine methyltransferase